MKNVFSFFLVAMAAWAGLSLMAFLSPINAAKGETQCGKYLVKTSYGDWRVNVDGEGERQFRDKFFRGNVIDRPRPELLFRPEAVVYQAVREEAGLPCLASLPVWKEPPPDSR